VPNASPSLNLWWGVLVGGCLVVVVVALLLGLVINLLRQIDRHAARTHTAAKQIAQNTVALWTLEQTNRDLVAIRDAASGAEQTGMGNATAVPLSGIAHKVQDWLGTSSRDDGSS
jgi:hypothetical protein